MPIFDTLNIKFYISNDYQFPNGPKYICRMSSNYLVKKARHLAEMFSRCLQGFYKSKQKRLTKALTKAS